MRLRQVYPLTFLARRAAPRPLAQLRLAKWGTAPLSRGCFASDGARIAEIVLPIPRAFCPAISVRRRRRRFARKAAKGSRPVFRRTLSRREFARASPQGLRRQAAAARSRETASWRPCPRGALVSGGAWRPRLEIVKGPDARVCRSCPSLRADRRGVRRLRAAPVLSAPADRPPRRLGPSSRFTIHLRAAPRPRH